MAGIRGRTESCFAASHGIGAATISRPWVRSRDDRRKTRPLEEFLGLLLEKAQQRRGLSAALRGTAAHALVL